MKMELRHLRTFVATVEQGTVSGAAERLHIAQPALSRQIRDLEAELGVRLFERFRKRLVLTADGEALLGQSRALLDAARALIERARTLDERQGGTLRIAATPQSIEGVLASSLRRHSKRHPNVVIELAESSGPELLAMVERGDVHLAIALRGLAQNYRDAAGAIATADLRPVEFVAVSAERTPLTDARTIDIVELARHPLLMLDHTFFVRNLVDSACRVAGVRPNVVFESRTPHTLLALAEAGHGVAVVPSVLPTHRYRLRAVLIAHNRRLLRETLIICWSRQRELPRFVDEFRRSLIVRTRAAASGRARGSARA